MTGVDDGLFGVLFWSDRNDDDLLRRDGWRKDEAIIIGVRHDERSDEAGGNTPRGGVDELVLVVSIDEGDLLSLGKVLAKVVGGSGLDGFFVLDHGFDGESGVGAREALGFGFLSHDDRDGEEVTEGIRVELMDHVGFLESFFLGLMGGVAFLPEEFGSAEEETGAHFPAHDVGPLVDEEGEVTVGFDPARKGGSDDGLGSGANDVGLGEFALGDHLGFSVFVFLGFEAMMGDDGALGGEAFGVLGFFFEVGKGNEEGEVGVFVAGGLEAGVEITLNGFPDGESPRLDDHAATGFGVFSHVGCSDYLLVPLGKVFFTSGGNCILGFRHVGGSLAGRGVCGKWDF